MLSVKASPELQYAVIAYKRAPAEVRKGLRDAARQWSPDLVSAVRSGARQPIERAIVDSGKVSLTAKGLTARFGSGKWRRAHLGDVAGPYEFGTLYPYTYTEYLSRRHGRSVIVDRRTRTKVPDRTPEGRFIYPGVARATPALAARWLRLIAETYTI